MFKRLAIATLMALTFMLTSCVGATSGLQQYVNATKGYEFLYPNGWVPVKVSGGPDVVFHDLVERTENLSVIINPVEGDQGLSDLGTPTEVGYELSKTAIAPERTGRSAELVNAGSKTLGDQLYYLLEYEVNTPDQPMRHNLTSVAVSRGKLLTFSLSTTEKRWQKLHTLFEQVVQSFNVY
ncbi:photosystem II reaction center PsbP [Roseofilum reptotaenium CS-1145]|uniref:Photosystem II oxygen evolving complex protein PsbP n=1 Tax=Roseofilum reptotaenium AO1-A TaxID=1925591 RepID=A0A1L9QPK9_9CYAN|nr:photosystem II reaction center PsbP [Roseofilum reptotaenium]MDB9515790.1 photosystem II reaction center PsbP [Roseofilum reptotaenium CS-1145]OJJ24610.1 photosystem II oxygen evolving complex protein PsbP [Roseofilum reptotaenium AO1-A]